MENSIIAYIMFTFIFIGIVLIYILKYLRKIEEENLRTKKTLLDLAQHMLNISENQNISSLVIKELVVKPFLKGQGDAGKLTVFGIKDFEDLLRILSKKTQEGEE